MPTFNATANNFTLFFGSEEAGIVKSDRVMQADPEEMNWQKVVPTREDFLKMLKRIIRAGSFQNMRMDFDLATQGEILLWAISHNQRGAGVGFGGWALGIDTDLGDFNWILQRHLEGCTVEGMVAKASGYTYVKDYVVLAPGYKTKPDKEPPKNKPYYRQFGRKNRY